MFEHLQPAPADKIIALIGLYRADPRPDKVDLGVGVYKDRDGKTPVMRAVREAEKRLLQSQDTKTYLGLAGDTGFNTAMAKLAFGPAADMTRIRAAQAPGGSGALRLVAELLKRTRSDATIWLSDPTWPNHLPVMRAAGLQIREYPYFDAASGAVRFADMLAALRTAKSGDVVLLHGCCHNPTGANLDAAQWAEIADLVVERGLLPFVDIAYQGFGDGLEADAAGLRLLAAKVPEMVVASSCSKNFAVYRDRVGAAMILAKDGAQADVAMGQMLSAARAMYSMPPDHGAAAVRIVLEDATLARRLGSGTRGDAPAHAAASRPVRRGAAAAVQFRPLRFRRQPSRHVFPAWPVRKRRSSGCAPSTASTWSATAASTSPACPRTAWTNSPRRSSPSSTESLVRATVDNAPSPADSVGRAAGRTIAFAA